MSNQDELLQLFSSESLEHLDALEADLIALEKDSSNPDFINRIFRAVHSIKGSSGFFGLENIMKLSHTMENLMALARDNTLEINPEIINAILKGSDKLRTIISDLNNWGSYDINQELDQLKQCTNAPKEENNKEFVVKLFNPEPYLFKDFVEKKHNIFTIDLWFKKDIENKELNILGFLKEIEPLGIFIDSAIDTSSIKPFSKQNSQDIKYTLLMSTHMEANMVCGALDIDPSQIQQIEPNKVKKWLQSKNISTPPSNSQLEELFQPFTDNTKSSNKKNTPPSVHKKNNDTIRIPVSLLDELMNLAGEMVLSRNQLIRIEEHSSEDSKLTAISHNIDSITTRFQEKVMQARLQPVDSVFSKFNRIVRDLASDLKKEFILKIESNNVELDKSIIEGLSDPLTHLIRNCADHGIESPHERKIINKPQAGTIQLKAKHVGSQVLIEITDDGRGIDPEIIKQNAIKKNLITKDEAQKLSPKQLINLVFEPGFSTAKQLSNVSGRGVGMDVVRTNIEKLGGSVELESTKNKGTKFSLCLPLTLAIIPSIIIQSNNTSFAIPQANIAEIVKANKNNKIEHIKGQYVLKLRDTLLPLIDLRKTLFNQETNYNDQEETYIVVAKLDSKRFGIIIDKIKDNEEIVVKPLSKYLKNLDFYSGSTIMGDGKIAMILNISGIYHSFIKNNNNEEDLSTQQNIAEIEDHLSSQQETQTLLLFKHHPNSLFAVNLAMIARIEKIKKDQISIVGTEEFINHNNVILKLIRMENYMPVSPLPDLPDDLYILIPRLVKYPMGIITTQIVDITQEHKLEFNDKNLHGTGILGSGLVRDQLTIHLDPYSLFEAVDPKTYNWNKKEFTNTLKNKRILFAEDTPFFRSVITGYLKEASCTVDVVNDGQEAWDKLENNNNYDLIITDIEMPRMDGFELTKRIRQDNRLAHLPVLALTSLASEDKKDQGKAAGFSAYEVKIDKEKLRNTIETLCKSTLS